MKAEPKNWFEIIKGEWDENMRWAVKDASEAFEFMEEEMQRRGLSLGHGALNERLLDALKNIRVLAEQRLTARNHPCAPKDKEAWKNVRKVLATVGVVGSILRQEEG